jgi:hypothetical protein
VLAFNWDVAQATARDISYQFRELRQDLAASRKGALIGWKLILFHKHQKFHGRFLKMRNVAPELLPDGRPARFQWRLPSRPA